MMSCNYRYLAPILGLLGCSSTNSSTATLESQTLVAVDPKDFMADGVCGRTVQRYVATLIDESGPSAVGATEVSQSPFLVGSSKPMPCNESIAFGKVVAYHAYEAKLDGYDRTDIEPAAPGSSAMILGEQLAPPRWTATCHGWTDADGGAEPGISYPNITVNLRNCTKLGQDGK